MLTPHTLALLRERYGQGEGMTNEELKAALGGLTETTEYENGTVGVLHVTTAGTEYRVEDADDNKALMTLATYLKVLPKDEPEVIAAPAVLVPAK